MRPGPCDTEEDRNKHQNETKTEKKKEREEKEQKEEQTTLEDHKTNTERRTGFTRWDADVSPRRWRTLDRKKFGQRKYETNLVTRGAPAGKANLAQKAYPEANFAILRMGDTDKISAFV